MFSIEDIWEILFDLEMASLYLEEQITYKLETHHWTRAQTWLAYPPFFGIRGIFVALISKKLSWLYMYEYSRY